MYVGRFVIVGPEVGVYRVSSRSFPHRQIVDRNGVLTVQPTPEAPKTDNPYVTYNCLRTTDEYAVLGNGSHVDPIVEKLALGYPPRDALASVLLALDFEKDDYETPRLAGVLGDDTVVGIVRSDALLVEAVDRPTLVATYGKDAPEPIEFEADSAAEAATAAFELSFEHAVCAASVLKETDGWVVAVENGLRS
jgi:IMP cyclohydrolase